ncbi:MAG: hypothetical protein ACKVQS_06335 [Fimbriimonadaceae bacterium]
MEGFFRVLFLGMERFFELLAMNQIASIAPCLFFCFSLVFVCVMFIVASNLQKKKAEELLLFATQSGMEFRRGLDGNQGGLFDRFFAGFQGTQTFLKEYEGFQPIFRTNATVKYIFDGLAGDMPFQAFHYQYTSSSGKNSQTHYYMVASVEMPIWTPDLSVSTEDVIDKIGKAFGGQDIQFESEDFNRQFRITGSVEKFAHDVMHPQMMEWFMSVIPPGFQMKGRRVVLWRNGQLGTDFVKDSRAMLGQFWDLVPEYVKEEAAK